MAQMHRERAHWLFRFWHRFTVTKKSERAGVDPPVHRPHLIEWDEWLWQHRRRKQLMRQAKLTHRHFRLRFCFYWLRWHAARNIKMREAWKFAARVNPNHPSIGPLLSSRTHCAMKIRGQLCHSYLLWVL